MITLRSKNEPVCPHLHGGYGYSTYTCQRAEGHIGQHQQIIEITPEQIEKGYAGRLAEWSRGGSSCGWIKNEDVADLYLCVNCNALVKWHYSSKPLKENICFYCDYWMKLKIQDDEKGNGIVINGRHYVDAGRNYQHKRQAGYGFDGARSLIKFFDGRILESYDLWTQGEVPSHFRDQFPDNAEMMSTL